MKTKTATEVLTKNVDFVEDDTVHGSLDDVLKAMEEYKNQFSQLPASVTEQEVEKLRMVADLISRIYHYGNFKAETHNERKLEKLLNELGLYPTTEDKILSRSLLNHPPVMGEGWVSVDERLPDEICNVLVFKGNGKIVEMSYHAPFDSGRRIFQWWGFGKWNDQHSQITHWMPLPPPPHQANTSGR